jgi:hypothetical protein
MTGIDHVDQSRAEQVILFRDAGMGLHWRPEIARFLAKAYETLQSKANKTADSEPKINVIEIVQAGLKTFCRLPTHWAAGPKRLAPKGGKQSFAAGAKRFGTINKCEHWALATIQHLEGS